jgi:hypothetical protein
VALNCVLLGEIRLHAYQRTNKQFDARVIE